MNLELYSELIALIALLLYLMAIASAIDATMNVRTAQGAIAWAISLLTIPYLALPFYLVFGRNKFAGYLEKREAIRDQTSQLLKQAHNAMDQFIVGYSDELPLYNSLYNLSRTPATRGNHVELLIDGEATFNSILSGIEAAKHYVLIEFYIIRDDGLGGRFTDVLTRKAQQGVAVFLLFDEIGSRNFQRSKMFKKLRKAGVNAVAFNTTQGFRNRFQLNFRNHRKIVVVDGEQAWVGGHNIADEYLGYTKKRGFWRDTHARLEGPAVSGAELTFATDWRWATRSPLQLEHRLEPRHCGDSKVLVFASDPVSTLEEASLMFHQVIVEARTRIWIASPYFVPDRGIVSALQLAALRGVDVRLIIPDEPDGPVVAMANWAFTRELLPAGVKVYRYQGGFMHQKVLLMDNKIAGVGTANFDNRSFRLNFEITLLVHCESFCEQVQTMLENDVEKSRQVTSEEIANKSIFFYLGMGIARLFSPLL
ncbi:cardiolipin synthase [Parahaliea sp. F7430]|uniref:Cardiolipin synthase n=1 Tax=Sediminihaliea albiluteola TaxID=2758564 RepID=A0A7W2TVX7_9GAMM|nr:cardiolipin synthase [Sediminihaliea albiluteola]MBA6412901.1 cardiolipin synthase [Sediminihaliea albiluteola]